MNFINVNWNGTAFVGNPIPPNKPNINESLETNPYSSAFRGVSQEAYNGHFDPANANNSSTKTVEIRNSVSTEK